MGCDFYLASDEMEKSICELQKRLKKVEFDGFFKELKSLCSKYNFFLTEINANNEYRLFEYIFDEPKETINSKIYDAYMGGSLANLGINDILYLKLFVPIDNSMEQLDHG